MTKVVCVRFNSGEEIIGRYEDSFINTNQLDDKYWVPTGTITLHQILSVNVQQVGPKQLAIGFMPFAIAGSQDASMTFVLDNCAITVYPPSPEIEKDYLAQTSKIALATPGLKL
jgi:hypothetical protein